MFPISKALVFALAYTASLLVLALMNTREFRRRPEKRERYRALPVAYKLACWFFVVPLFAGTIVEGVLLIPAVASFAVLEGACVRWYSKSGPVVAMHRCGARLVTTHGQHWRCRALSEPFAFGLRNDA